MNMRPVAAAAAGLVVAAALFAIYLYRPYAAAAGAALVLAALALVRLRRSKRRGFTDPRAYEIVQNIDALEERLAEKRTEVEDYIEKTEAEVEVIRAKDAAYNGQVMHFHQEAFMALRAGNASSARTFVMNKLAIKAKLKSKDDLMKLVGACRTMLEGIANHQQSLRISREEAEALGKRAEPLQDEDPYHLIVETLSAIDRDLEGFDERLESLKEKKRDIQSASVKVEDERVDAELVELEKEAAV
jgi:hypothetical protein